MSGASYWRYSTARALPTVRRPPSTPSCSTRGAMWRRWARCTACCKAALPCANAVTSCAIRSTPSRSCWPSRRTRCGAGISPNSRAGPGHLLPPVRHSRHLQPLRRRLDGGRAGNRRTSRTADRRQRRKGKHRARHIDLACRPRQQHALQAGGYAAVRSGHRQIAQPPLRFG